MRYCLFPIEHMDIWKAYKQHMHAFWTAEEIDFVSDRVDWETRLTPDERYFVENMLAFFAGSDGIVLENLVQNFCQEIEIPEARCFYAFQAMMENIHCVDGETRITTKEWGEVPIRHLVDRPCFVWNGHQFSDTIVRYTGDQPLSTIRLRNGKSLRCTPGHIWYTLSALHTDEDGKPRIEKKETRALTIGTVIAPFTYPDGTSSDTIGGFVITDILHEEGLHKTYCFNEPLVHKGMFNGILTGQSEAYSLMIDTFVKQPDRKQELFDAIHRIPCVQKKAVWALKWISKDVSLPTRLFAFGIVEGVFFSGAFCAIFWLKERGLLVNSLGKSNEWIARDEGLHTQFAVLMYHKLVNKIDETRAHEIMGEAVRIETEFIVESIPVRLIGMNHDSMTQYIRFVADRLLVQFGFARLFHADNPFPFMEKIGLDGKTNFFEQRVSEYSRISDPKNGITIDAAFLDSSLDDF